MSNPFSAQDAFFDSEDLMSWLLLNPDVAELDDASLGSSFLQNDLPDLDGAGGGGAGGGGDAFDFVKKENTADANVAKKRSSQPPYKASKIKQQQSASSSSSSKATKVLSQKRPRESIEDIEARVEELKNENTDLQAHLMNVNMRTHEVQKQRQAMERLMVGKLAEVGENEDAASQIGLGKVVKQYTDIYADYGKCRQREIKFHLDQLEKLLLPTKTTKMSLWALQQGPSFFQTSKSPMFDLIAKKLELTPEQTEKIQERREKINELLGQLKESLSLINSFKSAIHQKHETYDSICGRVQGAATAKQTVLFLKWISNHADELSGHIPNYTPALYSVPNVEFVEGVTTNSPDVLNSLILNGLVESEDNEEDPLADNKDSRDDVLTIGDGRSSISSNA